MSPATPQSASKREKRSRKSVASEISKTEEELPVSSKTPLKKTPRKSINVTPKSVQKTATPKSSSKKRTPNSASKKAKLTPESLSESLSDVSDEDLVFHDAQEFTEEELNEIEKKENLSVYHGK